MDTNTDSRIYSMQDFMPQSEEDLKEVAQLAKELPLLVMDDAGLDENTRTMLQENLNRIVDKVSGIAMEARGERNYLPVLMFLRPGLRVDYSRRYELDDFLFVPLHEVMPMFPPSFTHVGVSYLARRIRRHLDSRAVILLNLSVNDRGEAPNDESITEVLVEAYAETVTRDRSYEATMAAFDTPGRMVTYQAHYEDENGVRAEALYQVTKDMELVVDKPIVSTLFPPEGVVFGVVGDNVSLFAKDETARKEHLA